MKRFLFLSCVLSCTLYSYSLDIVNITQADSSKIITTINATDSVDQELDQPTFIIVDESASFQGGDINTFRIWVQTNLIYPETAAKGKKQGKVVVQFSVSSKGNVVCAKVLRSVDPVLDIEALRCINSSPKWLPAKHAGKNVKQQFVIPIVYQLQ